MAPRIARDFSYENILYNILGTQRAGSFRVECQDLPDWPSQTGNSSARIDMISVATLMVVSHSRLGDERLG